MQDETGALGSGLVDIARDFVVAHRLTRRLLHRYRAGKLRFEEVKELVGDSEDSVLFRLKERCHVLFREAAGAIGVRMRREALFDLAVGSLFHEAMKFRENFYQRAVYGPKVRELRTQTGQDADELFREFEKILDAASVRLDEALQETEALLAQTLGQFRLLLEAHRSNGLVARYLIENAGLAEEVFGQDLDSLLTEVYGSPAQAYTLAVLSYLRSGYFAEGRLLLDRAIAHTGERADLLRFVAYAEGMAAYLDGRYPEAVESLTRWLDAGPTAIEGSFAELAGAAMARVPHLVDEEERRTVGEAASRLAERIQPGCAGEASSTGGIV
jgi:tetratricopeptide (TPR) repeat protein